MNTFKDLAYMFSRLITVAWSERTNIIHHIWFTGISRDNPAEIPEIWSGAQVLCREKNPDYKFYMWSTEAAWDFLQEIYEWFIPPYDGYRLPIQRVDALKYFLLFHYGGVYIDLDI